MGNWENDRIEGYGIFYSKDGRKVYEVFTFIKGRVEIKQSNSKRDFL